MATFTLNIDETTMQGRSLIDMLKTLDCVKSFKKRVSKKEAEAIELEKKAFLETSRRNAAEIFSKYL